MKNSVANNQTNNNAHSCDDLDAHAVERADNWVDAMVEQSREHPHTTTANLTPELAAALLKRNEANRVIKDNTVSRYAADMTAGRWDFNGEAIIISSDGTTNDGQHRCLAVIKSGVSVKCVFVFGVSRESRLTTDQGAQKTAGDYLAMEGVQNSNSLAASATCIIQLERYGKFASGVNMLKPSKSEVRERVILDTGVEASFRFIRQPGANRIAPLAILTTMHYLASQVDPHDADAFMTRLIDGSELKARDPIFVLREKLRTPALRLNRNERVKAMITAWNHWRRGREVRNLPHTIRKGEKLPELK